MPEASEVKNKLSFIFGKKMKDQAKLIRLARKESNKWRYIKLDGSHYNYLFDFFKKNSILIFGLLALLFAQGIIETSLLVTSRNQLIGTGREFITSNLWIFFAIFIIIFLLNSYFAIRYERSLLVILSNSIRRRIFKNYISRPMNNLSDDKQAGLIAKISYHLPLVSLGVSNSFFGFWRWLVYLGIILVIAHLGNFNLLIIGACFFGLSIILALIAYFIARFYISQEVTFYSRIIKDVDFNASNINFLKTFGQENAVINKFDKLVWFDSFFRVKRDILLRIGFKVVFALLIIISLFSHFFPKNFSAFIGMISSFDKLFFLFLIIYFSRALNEAVKVGLYLFPARLGLFLTILKPGRTSVKDSSYKLYNKTLTFYAQKLKLFKEGYYFRDLRFVFSPGDRVSFIGKSLAGKTALAKLFVGVEAYNHLAAKVIVDKERLEYTAWQKMSSNAYFFNPNFRTDRSLMEFILGKTNDMILMEEIDKAFKIINQYPAIAKLISTDGNYNIESTSVLANPVQSFALQALHCLVNNSYFIVIDNLWLDLNYAHIINMIKVLNESLPKSVIITFAQEKNSHLNYNQQYEISEKIISI